MSIVVLVTGGRYYGCRRGNDVNSAVQISAMFDALDALHEGPRGPITLIRHGAAKGADHTAQWWADTHSVRTDPMPADWAAHGDAAGPMRNQAMASKTAAEPGDKLCLVAPGGRGTADCVRRARAVGIEIVEVEKGCAE